MAVGSDGRYYAEAKLPKAVRDELAERAKPEEDAKPKIEANKSVDPANHPAAGGEKVATAVKDQQKK